MEILLVVACAPIGYIASRPVMAILNLFGIL